jgi:hypothetical protein
MVCPIEQLQSGGNKKEEKRASDGTRLLAGSGDGIDSLHLPAGFVNFF